MSEVTVTEPGVLHPVWRSYTSRVDQTTVQGLTHTLAGNFNLVRVWLQQFTLSLPPVSVVNIPKGHLSRVAAPAALSAHLEMDVHTISIATFWDRNKASCFSDLGTV